MLQVKGFDFPQNLDLGIDIKVNFLLHEIKRRKKTHVVQKYAFATFKMS